MESKEHRVLQVPEDMTYVLIEYRFKGATVGYTIIIVIKVCTDQLAGTLKLSKQKMSQNYSCLKLHKNSNDLQSWTKSNK